MRTLLLMMAFCGCATASEARPMAECSGDLAAISPGDVLRVEPLEKVTIHQRGDVDREVRGARVWIKAQPGLTREWLQHSLSCRPELLAGDQAVSIAVESDGDQFRVDVYTSKHGERVLARAHTFAQR
jgi:hypothetical protein